MRKRARVIDPESIRRSYRFATSDLVLSDEEAIQVVAEALNVPEEMVRQVLDLQPA